jgi:ornithine cyclodeaminase
MIGAGALAPHLIAAHAAVRPIREVVVWNRTAEAARRLAASLDRPGLSVTASDDREAAVGGADIVSAATMTRDPLVRGAHLKLGTHVDLVGAFTPEMREADDEAVRRATVFVDTRAGMRESGDIAEPLASGALTEAGIAGDLHELARGAVPGRRSADEITLFKSVGNAIEDLAAAVEVWRRLNGWERPDSGGTNRLTPGFVPNPAP